MQMVQTNTRPCRARIPGSLAAATLIYAGRQPGSAGRQPVYPGRQPGPADRPWLSRRCLA